MSSRSLRVVGQLGATLGGDVAVDEHVNVAGLDVAQDAGVVRDEHDAAAGLAVDAVDASETMRSASTSRPESVSSRTAKEGLRSSIWRISRRFFVAAGEADVDVTLGEVGIHAQVFHGGLHVLDPRTQGGSLTVDGGLGGAQEVGDGHARNLDGVLHGRNRPALARSSTLISVMS